MRTVTLELKVQMQIEVGDDMTEEFAQFHYEENHCTQNLVKRLYDEMEANPGRCNLCHRAEVTLISIASAETPPVPETKPPSPGDTRRG